MNSILTGVTGLDRLISPVPVLPARQAIRNAIDRSVHFLPTQGPLSVFVHHNTLHSFEDLPFTQAVVRAGELYDCEPYLSENRYREELQRGRIRIEHLNQILNEDLGDRGDEAVAGLGSRFSLRAAMLQAEIQPASTPELRWLLAETDLLTQFHSAVAPHRREEVIERTRAYFLRHTILDHSRRELEGSSALLDLADGLIDEFGRASIESWSQARWESFTLHLLWKVCRRGIDSADAPAASFQIPLTFTDLLQQSVGHNIQAGIDEILIRFCGVYLDQGFTAWPLPKREEGFAASFAQLYGRSLAPLPRWMAGIQGALREIRAGKFDPLTSIEQSLEALIVPAEHREAYIQRALLTLRGWAGMLWQVETAGTRLPNPIPKGSLDEYLAVRLLLERYAVAHAGAQHFNSREPQIIRERAASSIAADQVASHSLGQFTYTVFQLAQLLGWSPLQLVYATTEQWTTLLQDIEEFSAIERRRIFHEAYERQYRNAALDALAIHSHRRIEALKHRPKAIPAFHASFCLDDREESFRRHLEEVDPACETSSAAGFFAVAMNYRGADHANFRALCPNIIAPKHYVSEQPVFSAVVHHENRVRRRRRLGQIARGVHSNSRTLLGGWVTGIFGALATFPMVVRILAPGLAATLRRSFGTLVKPPATELNLERKLAEPGRESDAQGYSIQEMADIVLRILQDIGLVGPMPRIVLMVGHGSSSLNNPHESAYCCGACSGGRGGPNARVFAQMANDPRVRRLVAERGLRIPKYVWFVGAYHDTCTDEVQYFDLDALPRSHRRLFRRVEKSINLARARNAHERSRRFHLLPQNMTPGEALKQVERRAEDLSQARPEYNHATNALVVVGDRAWSRGLFMDRRAFVTSYDKNVDDAEATVLTRILQAAIPVCAGISLEYYFSTVDTEGYGCGSKLPHNVTSMLGVMAGAASDLRTGLSQQMVEIHEPMRALFVIETSPEKMLKIMAANPQIARLAAGNWVHLAVINPEESSVQLYHQGCFVPYVPESTALPEVESSIDWYRWRSDHLGFASVVDTALQPVPSKPGVSAEPQAQGGAQ